MGNDGVFKLVVALPSVAFKMKECVYADLLNGLALKEGLTIGRSGPRQVGFRVHKKTRRRLVPLKTLWWA